MLITALFSLLSGFISTISNIFPTFDLQTPYNTNIKPIIDWLAGNIQIFGYFLAFDHLMIAISPVLLYIIISTIINNISIIKTLVKWW